MRLPNGVFAPYTSIPTNLLFFDRSHPIEEIWYYEQPQPTGRKNYTKTTPSQFEEFADCLAWWQDRVENERAWRVCAKDVLKYDDDILKKEQRIAELMEEIKAELQTETAASPDL